MHIIEENDEDSKEETVLKTEENGNLNPFSEIDDFIGIKKDPKLERPKLFDMGDDIHNLCDTPEIEKEKEELKDALADIPIRSSF